LDCDLERENRLGAADPSSGVNKVAVVDLDR
jgi:hypothetical protein